MTTRPFVEREERCVCFFVPWQVSLALLVRAWFLDVIGQSMTFERYTSCWFILCTLSFYFFLAARLAISGMSDRQARGFVSFLGAIPQITWSIGFPITATVNYVMYANLFHYPRSAACASYFLATTNLS
jgi:hypothetical protein